MRINSEICLGVGILIGLAVGKLLFGVHVPPNGQSSQVVAGQKASQKQGLKCTVVKKTAPSGESEVVFESIAVSGNDSAHDVKVSPAPAQPLNALVLGGYVNPNLSSGASVGLNTPEWDLDISSDLKKDHRLEIKRTLLRW